MGIQFNNITQRVQPDHTALIVVDVQNDFCAPEGEYARRGRDISMMLDMAPRLANLIEGARQQGLLVVFLRGVEGVASVLSDAWSELVNQRTDPAHRVLGQEGTWGADFFAPVVPSDKDVVITKYRYSGFTGTNLDQVLRSKNILTVIATGVITQVCVEATVRAACDLDYRVVVVDDCTATTSQEIQHNALERMAAICADRITSDMLLGLWGID
jgi:ureidoacrylate peracid hydrolase